MNHISASQIDTYEDCNRFWWFQRILRLKEPPSAHFTFGTVLHGVCERYLSATMNGRVPTPGSEWPGWEIGEGFFGEGPLKGQVFGDPVNLYPPGWLTVTERDGTEASIDSAEGKLIQRLVAEAIESGVLVRSEHVQVERRLELPVIEGTDLIGYIDVYRPKDGVRPLPKVEDHKSYGKGSVRFLKRSDKKSPNYLGKNLQVLTYAWAISELDGHDGPVVVQHNQFPKFPDRPVTQVETTIDRQTIVEHGKYLREVAGRMALTRGTKDWGDVAGPKDSGKCARWYGKPCPFANICGMVETPDAYKDRLDRVKSGSVVARFNLPLLKPKTNTEGTSMSIFDRASKQKAGGTANREAAGTAQAKAEADAPAVNGAAPVQAVDPVVTIQHAPWANPKCPACKGRGVTSKNKTCPICDATAKQQGRATSMSYIVEFTDEGLAVAVAREDAVADLEAAGLPLEWDESAAPVEPAPVVAEKPKRTRRTKAQMAQARAEAAAPEPAASPQTQTTNESNVEVSDPVHTHAASPAETAAASVAVRRGRPSVGLTILIGANYLMGMPKGRTIITSDEVVARFGAELAADMGAESYWELDSFKRRDRLAQKAGDIVTALAKHILIHPRSLSPHEDGSALVQALMGQAEGVDAVIGRIA